MCSYRDKKKERKAKGRNRKEKQKEDCFLHWLFAIMGLAELDLNRYFDWKYAYPQLC